LAVGILFLLEAVELLTLGASASAA